MEYDGAVQAEKIGPCTILFLQFFLQSSNWSLSYFMCLMISAPFFTIDCWKMCTINHKEFNTMIYRILHFVFNIHDWNNNSLNWVSTDRRSGSLNHHPHSKTAQQRVVSHPLPRMTWVHSIWILHQQRYSAKRKSGPKHYATMHYSRKYVGHRAVFPFHPHSSWQVELMGKARVCVSVCVYSGRYYDWTKVLCWLEGTSLFSSQQP